jgi:hypothetical protein
MFERVKWIGLLMLCAALTLAVRRNLASSRGEADQSVQPVSSMQENGVVWTIPVEIVETGQAPRLHQVPLRN